MTGIQIQRTDWLLVGLAAFVVGLFVLGSGIIHEVGFPLDDSWIHQTYARNLAERGEWAFVPGEPSVASTSPLYTVLLALGYVLDINFFVWTFFLGAFALAAAGLIGARLGPVMFPKRVGVGLWTGLALLLTWHLVWAAASGMETMLFATLSLAVVGLSWRELDVNTSGDQPLADAIAMRRAFGRGALLGVVGAALTLTRPEGVGLVGLSGLFVLLSWPYASRADGIRLYLAWGMGVALGWLIAVAPYALLNYDIEGTLLPNTSSAKQAENAPARDLALLERYLRMILPLAAGGQLLLLPGMVVGVADIVQRARADRRVILLLLPLAWAFMQWSAYAIRLPAPYQHGRYVIPMLPHLLLYGVGGTLIIVERTRRRAWQRIMSRSLALASVAVFPAFLFIGGRQYGYDVRIINTEMVDTAHWLRANVPPDELLAVHDIGAVGYYAPRPMLDLAGLVSPEVVPIILDHEALMTLMCERGARYLMVLPDQRPAEPDDPRLGTEVEYDPELGRNVIKPNFVTGAPYAPDAGGENMMVYKLNWPDDCAVSP